MPIKLSVYHFDDIVSWSETKNVSRITVLPKVSMRLILEELVLKQDTQTALIQTYF